jgi:hypothetical protein
MRIPIVGYQLELLGTLPQKSYEVVDEYKGMADTELEDQQQSSLMSNHFDPNTYNREHRQHGQLAAFLLGIRPMPPPTQQELSVAMANHLFDNGTPRPADLHDRKEKIDPQLCTAQGVAPARNRPLSKSYSVVPR